MNGIEKVNQYLSEAGVFFLATENGDQPKCRPLGLHTVIDGQLYFGVGDFKDVYRQLQNNPKVEINACKKSDWLRVYGTAVFEQDDRVAQFVLGNAPFLKSIYNEQTGHKLAVFHLESATAEFRSMMKVEEKVSF